MPMPSAAEYAGKLSGLEGAKDWPDLTHEDLDGKTPEEQTAYLQRVSEHYRPQRDMIQRVADLARFQMWILKELQGELQLTDSQGWDEYTQLPPFPLPGNMSPVAATKLAPAMASAVALLTFLQMPLAAFAQLPIPQDVADLIAIATANDTQDFQATAAKCMHDIAIIGREPKTK